MRKTEPTPSGKFTRSVALDNLYLIPILLGGFACLVALPDVYTMHLCRYEASYGGGMNRCVHEAAEYLQGHARLSWWTISDSRDAQKFNCELLQRCPFCVFLNLD